MGFGGDLRGSESFGNLSTFTFNGGSMPEGFRHLPVHIIRQVFRLHPLWGHLWAMWGSSSSPEGVRTSAQKSSVVSHGARKRATGLAVLPKENREGLEGVEKEERRESAMC